MLVNFSCSSVLNLKVSSISRIELMNKSSRVLIVYAYG